MAASLAHQRCTLHAQREAVARCPSCRRYFCRECVTEHDDQLLCAQCLARQADAPRRRRARLAGVARALLFACTLFFTWFCFYYCGKALLELPSTYHEMAFLSKGGSGGGE